MRGDFYAGLALGAIMGAIVLEASPETKRLVRRVQAIPEESPEKEEASSSGVRRIKAILE